MVLMYVFCVVLVFFMLFTVLYCRQNNKKTTRLIGNLFHEAMDKTAITSKVTFGRDPHVGDQLRVGTIWVNKMDDKAFVLNGQN